MVEVVDMSSSEFRSDSASYRLVVVVELALPDRCSFADKRLVGDVSDRFRAVDVFRNFRGAINCDSEEPSF